MVEAVNTLAGTHEGHTAIHEAGHAVATFDSEFFSRTRPLNRSIPI